MSAQEEHFLNVALVGNPNTGKTTLFNALTGLRQRVGNYPGVTVEKKTGEFCYRQWKVSLIDLPGTYSLSASSPDERVVVDALSGKIKAVRQPDMIICVVDATNLQRNLFLASQVAELGIPMVIALNQWDLAQRRGKDIKVERLSAQLGVPVVPTSASRKEGLDALREAMAHCAEVPQRMVRLKWPECVEQATAHLRAILRGKHEQEVSEVELRRMLFDADSAVAERFDWGGDDRKAIVEQARRPIREAGLNPYSAEAVLHYAHLSERLAGVVCDGSRRGCARSESIDALLTHRVWGLAIFIGLMWLVFQSVYSWAGPLMDVIEGVTGWAQGLTASWLEGMPMVQSLVSDGIVGGVGGVVIFLPQILILFFFIGLLEDTGYMPRAAFLMDKVFGWCGLNGKSFVPLLSSYACAVPGVMAARTIEDPKARLTTVLIAPLMSCSARLPVYVLLIGAFVEPLYGPFVAGAALFAMHFVGLLVAMPVAWVLTRFVVRTRPQPFLLEMCPYRVPQLGSLLRRMWAHGKEFLVRAGTVIVAFSILIWALLYFPRPESVAEAARAEVVAQAVAEGYENAEALLESDEAWQGRLENATEGAYIEQSYMGRVGRAIQPIFDPAGFDWKITVGVVASFPAREVIIATMGIVYSLGADIDEESSHLRERMAAEVWPEGTSRAGQLVFNVPVALAIMVFFALCLQCGATVAVVAKETNWAWAVFSFVYMTLLAWVGAVAVYQLGMW